MVPSEAGSTLFLFLAVLAAVLLTLPTTLAAIQICRYFNLIDYPNKAPHKQHTRPTPQAGGIAIILSLLVLVLASGIWKDSVLRAALLGTLIIFIFGLWDDARGLSAPLKLLGQVMATFLLAVSGVTIRIFEYQGFFTSSLGVFPVILDWLITFLWVIGITNAFNLVDSMDGLAAGLSAWSFGFFTLATFVANQPALAALTAMMLGISITIQYFNSSPARIFLGDSGAQSIGFLLAVIGILYTPQVTFQASSWFVPILLVGVPIFDTTLVFFSRLRHHKPFYQSGLDHVYHRLVALGLNSNQAVMTIHLAALILDCIAFIAVALKPSSANIVFGICLVLGILALIFLEKPYPLPDRNTSN